MLIIASGSVCDICLEPFGRNFKVPCTIPCGHIFCINCLNFIHSICPLCRTYFNLHSHIKLHVDVYKAPPLVETTAEAEAHRFQEEIVNIVIEGTTEARLHQLIAECRNFLQDQPPALFIDLRVSYRMIAYLYDMKMGFGTQGQAVDTSTKESFANKDKPGSPLFSLLPGSMEREPKTDANEEIPDADDWEVVPPLDNYDSVDCNSMDYPASC